MTVYGLWQRWLFPLLLPVLSGFLWVANPSMAHPWHLLWRIGVVTFLLVAMIQALRARILLTPDRVRYVGLLRSWSMSTDQLVAIELRPTRIEMGNGAGSDGGFPVFRDREGHWHRCPMVAFRSYERAVEVMEKIKSYMVSHGHEVEITSRSTI